MNKFLVFIQVVAITVLMGCHQDRWENYSAEEREEIITGCRILWPLEFQAEVTHIEYKMLNIKRLPRWINATVFAGEVTPEVRKAINYQPHICYDFQNWPRIKVIADDELFFLFNIGDTMVKPRSSCSLINSSKPGKRVSVYHPFRHFP